MNKNTINHYKFTLIELLVVIAIIAITTNSSIRVKFLDFTPLCFWKRWFIEKSFLIHVAELP